MDFEKAKALVDKFEENEERFEREIGGREMIRWMVRELTRRRELREAQRGKTEPIIPEAPPAAPTGTLRGEPSATLIRRVEVLEEQLRHLTRRLEAERLI